MKRRLILSTLVTVCAGITLLAADPFNGMWKLNEAKSKIAPGAPKNSTVTYTAEGDNVKVVVEGTAADGSAMRSEWTGKFDGKDYPVTGSATSDSRSYTKVNDRTLSFTEKKDGKTSVTGRITVSADGKSRTVTASQTDTAGKKTTSRTVYEKQ
jgi:hypothetical protein